MSQENVDVIQRLYWAMDAQDAEAVAEIAAPDMEWIPDWRVGEGPWVMMMGAAIAWSAFRLEPRTTDFTAGRS